MSKSRRFGVLGRTLAHSHSPALFAERFKRLGIHDATYERFERPNLDGFDAWLETMAHGEPPLLGLNVTIPFKQSVLPFLKSLTPVASEVGAVNAIKPSDQGWIGHNTDVEGFLKPLRPFLRSEHERALILGNGGAAAAVATGLRSLGIEPAFVTRGPFEGVGSAVRFDELQADVLRHFKLIVHCTPVGTYPAIHESVPFPWEGIGPGHFVVDLVYNPAQTEFLKSAAMRGAETLNGKEMLYAQADAACNWWTAMD